MTEQTLKLYIELQPFFQERMGKWQEFDRGYSSCPGVGYSPGMVRGREFYYDDPKFTNASFCIDDHPDTIHLPLLIDIKNPERGLWGMMDWGLALADISSGGDINISDVQTRISLSDGWQVPELALLMAIYKQQKNNATSSYKIEWDTYAITTN